MNIISDVLDVIIKHITGPDNYLSCYENLLYITSGVAEKKLDNFFKLEPVPLLREFEQQIKAYDELRKKICMFRCKVSIIKSQLIVLKKNFIIFFTSHPILENY